MFLLGPFSFTVLRIFLDLPEKQKVSKQASWQMGVIWRVSRKRALEIIVSAEELHGSIDFVLCLWCLAWCGRHSNILLDE